MSKQIADQCKAVAHMARAIAEVYDSRADRIEPMPDKMPLGMIGRHSADLMEYLGDSLTGMDAVSEDDDWINPIMHEAQRLFPSRK